MARSRYGGICAAFVAVGVAACTPLGFPNVGYFPVAGAGGITPTPEAVDVRNPSAALPNGPAPRDAANEFGKDSTPDGNTPAKSKYDAEFRRIQANLSGATEVSPQAISVTQVESLLFDSARDREIPVRIRFPTAEQARPLIIISHGAGGSMDGFDNMGEYLASQGYVAMALTHYGPDGRTREEIPKRIGRFKLKRLSPDTIQLANRPQDISFILNSLGDLVRQTPVLDGKIDADRVGVVGHSRGGYTAMAVAGVPTTLPDEGPVSFRDDRVDAVVALDPMVPGATNDSIGFPMPSSGPAQVRIPTMVMSATMLDTRDNYYDALPPGNKYQIEVRGAVHSSFNDKGEPQFQAATMVSTLAMFDAYLKQHEPARDWLSKGMLAQASPGLLTVETK